MERALSHSPSLPPSVFLSFLSFALHLPPSVSGRKQLYAILVSPHILWNSTEWADNSRFLRICLFCSPTLQHARWVRWTPHIHIHKKNGYLYIQVITGDTWRRIQCLPACRSAGTHTHPHRMKAMTSKTLNLIQASSLPCHGLRVSVRYHECWND